MAALRPDQLAILENKLARRHESLLAVTREELAKMETRQYAEIVGREPTDPGDQSVGDELADLSQEIANRHLREVRDIEAAQARIDDGSYGICIACGLDIGFERLLAQPTASRCRSCQEQWEKTHTHEGSPRL
jgi:RNA polymerase-binding protein DksA